MSMSTTTRESTFHDIVVEPNLRSGRGLMIAGVIAVVTSFLIGLSGAGLSRFFHAYLLGVCFTLSISLGALFFVILHHLTGARWSVAIRRLAELLTTPLWALGLLMLPIIVPMFFGYASPFEWNDATLRATDELIQGKAGYLNAPFFALRAVGYFTVWTLLSRFFLGRSVRQDDSNQPELSTKMRRFSGPAMIAYAITVNFAAFDWLMSLDPHWFSTIFGIYFFAGSVVSFFAAVTIAAAVAQSRGYLKSQITTEHYHDLGKLLFGFIFFWAYIAFSQYLLIWYANIPEETSWFLIRQRGGWQLIGLVLILGHFVLPFCGLMSRAARRSRKTLLFWASIILLVHWIDLYWLVMPNVSPDVSLGFTELACSFGISAIWLATVLHYLPKASLLPTGDPYLRDSLAFHNH